MTGKRILDLAALFNASRGVTHKHIALRSRQLDVYSRTSTIARAVQNQTERVTETVKAAIVLGSRLNEGQPQWMNEETSGSTPVYASSGGAPGQPNAAESKSPDAPPKERLQTASQNFGKDGELEVKQAEASQDALPDGTVPPTKSEIKEKIQANQKAADEFKKNSTQNPRSTSNFKPAPWSTTTPYQSPLSSTERKVAQRDAEHQIPSRAADYDGFKDPLEEGHDEDSFYHKSQHVSPDLSSLPRVKVPKHISSVQGTDEHINVKGINSDSYSDNLEHTHTTKFTGETLDQQTPGDINTAIFNSPRVARMLGGKTHMEKQPELEMKHAKETPVEHTKLSEGKDQDSFNVRTSTQDQPTVVTPPRQAVNPELSEKSPRVDEDEVKVFAQEIAAEITPENKVGLFRLLQINTDR